MILPELKISRFVAYEYFCPFDRAAFNLLEKNKEAQIILKDFYALFSKAGCKFSAPGNSFGRKVTYELVRGFYQNQSKSNLILLIEKDAMLTNQYNDIRKKLLSIALRLKFRTLNASQLNLLACPEFINGVSITSRILTDEGIQATIDTFLNFPENICTEKH